MKKLKNIIFCTMIIGMLCCCHSGKNKDSSYFNGEIQYFDDNNSLKIVKNVTSKTTPVNDYNYGFISVYDSLIILWNPKLPEHFFKVFNIDTGEEIGDFCHKGKGPKESISIGPVMQFFKNENDIMTLLHAINERKIFLWNISQSIDKGVTIFDSIVPYANINKDKSSRLRDLFYQTGNTLFANVSSVLSSKDEATAPYYEKRTVYTNELMQDYHIYKKVARNGYATIMPTDFYYSSDVIKPDGSKIAQAMMYLPQINILDTRTGNVIGFRTQNGPGFSYFETKMDDHNVYYNSMQADDNYIYAVYWGKKQWDVALGSKAPLLNIIHVFDWHGKLIYELIADRSFFRIWLDSSRNRLYTSDMETNEVYYLDLNEIIMPNN